MHCQQSKVQHHVHSAVPHIPVPARRFSNIHVDLVGPLPSSRVFTHLFTIVDRTSCWPEAVPMSSTSAEDCARALIFCWISRFGIPSKITSDQGAKFPVRTTPCDKTGFSASEAVYASLCLPGEFLDSVDLPPREFLDRIF